MIENISTTRKPGPLRLLAVMLYDAMLLVSVLLVAAAVAVAFNNGEAIGANNPFFFIYFGPVYNVPLTLAGVLR